MLKNIKYFTNKRFFLKAPAIILKGLQKKITRFISNKDNKGLENS
jgi:hypothetical protein